jgi:Sec-independent protein translocase protein TatA
MFNKDKFFTALIIILILLLIFFAWRMEGMRNDAQRQTDELKKSIIASDKLVQESNGSYAKLVDYYKTERDLVKELKGQNSDLAKDIKKQDERILSLTSAVVTFKGILEEGMGKFNPNDSNQIDMALRYPDATKPFAKWDGYVNTKTAKYNGNWSFDKLPIQIVLTEVKRGLWKNRIVGPDWFIVDSLQVNSLPPDKYASNTEKKLQMMVGVDYLKPLSNKNAWGSIGVGVGLNILRQHNVIVRATTNQEVGVGYYYTVKSFKKNK